MKERLSVITRKGQITIPAEIRRALSLKEGDKVSFVLEDNQARVTRAGSVVERTAGILKTRKPARTARQMREAAEQAIADEASHRSGR